MTDVEAPDGLQAVIRAIQPVDWPADGPIDGAAGNAVDAAALSAPSFPLPTLPALPCPPVQSLSPDQDAALRAILMGIDLGQRVVTLAGAAGTGKTTLMREAIRQLRALGRQPALLAPTHKAAKVLRVKTGELLVGTVHSAVYKPPREGEESASDVWQRLAAPAVGLAADLDPRGADAVPAELLAPPAWTGGGAGDGASGDGWDDADDPARAAPAADSAADAVGAIAVQAGLPTPAIRAFRAAATRYARWQEGRRRGAAHYIPGDRLIFSELRDQLPSDLLVIDEASMLSEEIVRDIFRVDSNVQLLAVGDHCQLPPVEGRPGFDLPHATAVLDTIHRQAAGSPVLALATAIRQRRLRGDDIARAAATAGVLCKRAPLGRVADVIARTLRGETGFVGEGSEVAVVAQNLTRVDLNAQVRARLGYVPFMDGPPAVGERVVAVASGGGLRNGEDGVVRSVAEGPRLAGMATWRLELDDGEGAGADAGRPGGANEAGETGEAVHPAGRLRVVHLLEVTWAQHDPQRARQLKEGGSNLRDLGRPTREQALALRRAQATADDGQKAALDSLAFLAPAYAITAWKGQGSQWPSGIVLLEWAGWMEEKEWQVWYTAVTRFARSVLLVQSERTR